MGKAKIIGKARLSEPEKFTREYYEQTVIPWAKDLWKDHMNDLWSSAGKGCGNGYTESFISETFRAQFHISGSRYDFPDLSREHICSYSGDESEYMNGTMTEKERIIRYVCCQMEEIMHLCRLSGTEPVFDVLDAGIDADIAEQLGIAVVRYGTSNAFCLPNNLLSITYMKDYSQIPSHLLSGEAGESVLAGQLMELHDKSIVSIRRETQELSDAEEQLKRERSDISYCRTPELSDMQEKINKLQAELTEKKDSLRAELERKERELAAKKKQLENEMFLLETQIYSIRCANGEVYEIQQLRRGKNAPDELPLTMFQKVKCMDQELGYLASVYNVDYAKHNIFESLIIENPLAFETFCPTEKCIVVMRASEHARYHSWNKECGFTFYEKFHGNKTCVICRNGENLYILWTDDDYINISGHAFYQHGKVTEEQVDEAVVHMDTKEGRASRIFLMNILQGILEAGKIFPFPEKVSLLRPTRYITFSYADQYVTDNRFGTLADIQARCNQTIRKGDKVILLCDLHDSKHWVRSLWGSGGKWENCDRGHGESNRTKDCKLEKDTLYEINLVDNEEYFIRATKMIWKGSIYYGYKKETAANFKVYPNEILNLAYCNSIWMEYVLVARNIGNMNNSSSTEDTDYAGLVKALKMAKEYLTGREAEERAMIEEYTDLSGIPEWQVQLSEWKLQNKVRQINPYQAKRFATFISKGKEHRRCAVRCMM